MVIGKHALCSANSATYSLDVQIKQIDSCTVETIVRHTSNCTWIGPPSMQQKWNVSQPGCPFPTAIPGSSQTTGIDITPVSSGYSTTCTDFGSSIVGIVEVEFRNQ